jgi:hypothetical protein
MANDKYLPSSFEINVDPAVNASNQTGSALEDQLKLARWLAYGSRLAQAEAGVRGPRDAAAAPPSIAGWSKGHERRQRPNAGQPDFRHGQLARSRDRHR